MLNPGSGKARKEGCNCPILDNNYGRSAPRPDGGWVIRLDCPLHGEPIIARDENAERIAGFRLKIRSLETSLTPNQDGTHTLRAVAAGADPVEFLVHLEPFLITEIDIVEDLNLAKNEVGEVEDQPMLKLTLTVTAEVRTNPETGYKWQTKVLLRDDCGNPR